MRSLPQIVDCACVIHGDVYEWQYVEKLHAMLQRNFTPEVRLHVYTERKRPVPASMVKHELAEWPDINGHRRGWWYKMQLFDPRHWTGKLFYLDLDVVITGNLDWVFDLDPNFFWSIRDFRYLWRPHWQGLNSSLMYFDVERFSFLWQHFDQQDFKLLLAKYPGDQDFLTSTLLPEQLRFVEEALVRSWRWQIKDGGLRPEDRKYRRPDAGAILEPDCRVVIFHGKPKPHEVQDKIIEDHWR